MPNKFFPVVYHEFFQAFHKNHFHTQQKNSSAVIPSAITPEDIRTCPGDNEPLQRPRNAGRLREIDDLYTRQRYLPPLSYFPDKSLFPDLTNCRSVLY